MILVIDTKLVAYYLHHRREPIYKIFDFIAEKLHYNGVKPSQIKKVVFAMDANKRGRNRRRELYPEYKGNRKDRKKKLSPAEQDRTKHFEILYQKLERVFKYFGVVCAVGGVEADDIANIITEKFGNDHKILLMSSDRDWAFNFSLVSDSRSVRILHLTQGIVHKRDCQDVYGLPQQAMLPYQIYAGIVKENITGIYRLGVKTFMNLWRRSEADDIPIHVVVEEALTSGLNGMKLPKGVGSFAEMVERNTELLRPVGIADLTDEQASELITSFNAKKSEVGEDLMEMWFELFGTPPIFSDRVQKYFKISSPI